MENKYLVILNVIHDKRYDSFKGRNCLYDMIADVELKIITLKTLKTLNHLINTEEEFPQINWTKRN